MGLGKRVIFVLIGIIILLGGLFTLSLTLGFFDGLLIGGHSTSSLEGNLNIIILGFLVAVIGLLIIIFASAAGKKKESAGVVSFNEIGEFRISFRTIESIILTATQRIKGIREVTSHINSSEQGLVIYLRITTIPDIPIPALIQELQETVRDYVQEISGCNVAEVKVLVENISQEKIQKNPH